eukprot:752855-Hanusia_phi.AAC.6
MRPHQQLDDPSKDWHPSDIDMCHDRMIVSHQQSDTEWLTEGLVTVTGGAHPAPAPGPAAAGSFRQCRTTVTA